MLLLSTHPKSLGECILIEERKERACEGGSGHEVLEEGCLASEASR